MKTNKSEDSRLLFIIEFFGKMNIKTSLNQWKTVMLTDSGSLYNGFHSKMITTYYHKKFGFIEVVIKQGEMSIGVSLFSLLKKVMSDNDLIETKKLFKELMKKYRNPNIQYDTEEINMLITPVCKGHLEIVKFLVNNGVNIHTECEDVLVNAAIHKKTDMILYLLERDNRINCDVIYNNEKIDEEMKSVIKKWELNKSLREDLFNLDRNKPATKKHKI